MIDPEGHPENEGRLCRHGVISQPFWSDVGVEEDFVEIFSPCHDAGVHLDECYPLKRQK